MIKKRFILAQVLVWLGILLPYVFVFWSIGTFDTAQSRRIFIPRILLTYTIGFLVSAGIAILHERNNIVTKKTIHQVLIILGSISLGSLVSGIIEHYLFEALGLLASKEQAISKERGIIFNFAVNAMSWFIMFFPWGAIYCIFCYARSYQSQQLQTLQLSNLVKEWELKTIKSHINPHFIFNSLNGIKAMISEDPERARTAITELSNILRSSISIEKSETVLLKDELAIVKDYLALEHMRFEDRLHIQYDIAPDTLTKPIPPMMLQTIVENGIKHGISKIIDGGIIHITANATGDLLLIEVFNTGLYEPENMGFGINSIKDRLKLLYTDKASFNIEQQHENVVKSTLQIPIS